MKRILLTLLVTCSMATGLFAQANPKTGDPRLRDVVYDPAAVVTVPVKRGMVTLVVLAQDEVITEVAAGQGGDCSKADENTSKSKQGNDCEFAGANLGNNIFCGGSKISRVCKDDGCKTKDKAS